MILNVNDQSVEKRLEIAILEKDEFSLEYLTKNCGM